MPKTTDYTEELGDLICARIVETRTIAEALEGDGLPASRTFFRWLSLHETLRQNYARALEMRAEPDNEELRRVAYDMNIPADQKRIIVDTLKWQQARAAPKRYGEKLQTESVVRHELVQLTPDEANL